MYYIFSHKVSYQDSDLPTNDQITWLKSSEKKATATLTWYCFMWGRLHFEAAITSTFIIWIEEPRARCLAAMSRSMESDMYIVLVVLDVIRISEESATSIVITELTEFFLLWLSLTQNNSISWAHAGKPHVYCISGSGCRQNFRRISHQYCHYWNYNDDSLNRRFPSCISPLFQSES